jgi:hypothetical protein
VLHALLKKKYLLSRSDLVLEWEPLFQLYWFWEDSSLALRGLLKPSNGFKAQIKSAIKVSHECREVLGIRIRRIRMFLGLPDPDPLIRGMDPAPDPYPSLFS